jgi:putative redox protein
MLTSEVVYLGGLRTKCTHVRSGNEIITDAPLDNKGRGEAFSPTDLVATAYASCMITIMGIYCEEHGYEFTNAKAEIIKEMASSPRRIGKLIISMDLSNNGWSADVAEKVIRAGKACPVAKTLSDGVELEFTFKY